MISLLKGGIINLEENIGILEVNGVGYEVQLSGAALAKIGDSSDLVTLHTHMHIKDNGIDLYGFASAEEKSLFRRIITVSGTGCKTALNILLTMEAKDFIVAILNEDRVALTRVSGIGKKTADRLILELQDPLSKIYKESDFETHKLSLANGGIVQDALAALSALGYTWAEAEIMLRHAQARMPETEDLETLLKIALSSVRRESSS